MKKLLLIFMAILLLFLPAQLPGIVPAGESRRGLPLPGLAAAEDDSYGRGDDKAGNINNQPELKSGDKQEQTAENLPQEANSPPPPAKETELNPGATSPGQHGRRPAPAPETKTNEKGSDALPEQNDEPETDGNAPADNEKDNQYALEVFRLTNAEREKAGLPPLHFHSELSEVALIKAREMHDHGYFSHDSPTYGSPEDMVNYFTIPHKGVGENIAGGYRAPEDVMQGWMKSAGHRANILKPEYKSIGIGFYRGTNHYKFYWVQLFLLE